MLPDNIQLALELIGVDHASMTIDEAGEALRQYTQKAEQAGNSSSDAAKKSTMSWTEFRSAYSTVIEAARVGMQVWEETVGVTVELANNVRQFRDVTGQSAEESSRLVQVLDDYKITVGQAEQATKKFAKDGMEFNITTLASLSDEYLKLNSNAERTQFLYDKFGKSGTDFAEIMLQGSDAIMAANDAISKNLVFTDKQLEQSRILEKNLDNLNDSYLALATTLGNRVIPLANDFLEITNKNIDNNALINSVLPILPLLELATSYGKAEEASRNADTARLEGLASLYQTTEATDELTISTEELSRENEKYLSTIGSITKEIDNYKEKEDDLKSKHAELLAEKQKLLDEGWWAESEAVQAVNDKLSENEEAQAKNAAAFDEATKARMLSMLQEQLAVDGLSEKESAFLLEQGVKWGIYSQEAVDAMDAIQRKVDAMERNIDININVRTNYSESGQAALSQQLLGEKSYTPSPKRRENADGGTYMIPSSWGNERFPIGTSDTASGGELISITPAGKSPNDDILTAIQANRIDERKLARYIVSAMAREG